MKTVETCILSLIVGLNLEYIIGIFLFLNPKLNDHGVIYVIVCLTY